MKAVIFGGSGFIGSNLARQLLSEGYEVCIVTRGQKTGLLEKDVEIIQWQNSKSLSPIRALESVDVMINLAGESIGNRRWTDSVKQEIMMSRVKTTQEIVSAINQGVVKPKVLVNASAVGYYGPHEDEEITEAVPAGKDFLAEVCKAWEGEAFKVQKTGTRVAAVRIGVVLGDEGALKRMRMPFQFYLGGPLGSGNQWLSWIHLDDLTRLITFVIQNDTISGPVNATAPEPLRMKDFSSVLGGVLHKPSWVRVPEVVLKVALGEMAGMIIKGQRVFPQKAIRAGYEFRFPTLRPALEHILLNRN